MVLVYYLCIINIITFVVWGVDKRRAVKEQRRVSENTLLYLSVAGGCIGGVIGMSVRRHKTIKGSFLWKFWAITLLRLLLIFLLLARQSA
jgi:uncharacterized membrane protein YsdA (DUF1294 family)